MMASTIDLTGLDGRNPLAFLAALGTLRTVDRALGDDVARMGWSRRSGGWRPTLYVVHDVTNDELVDALDDHLRDCSGLPQYDLGQGENNLSVEPAAFREFARQAGRDASPEARDVADFAVAFGSEAAVDRRGTTERIRDTALRTMSGSGHQHFLGNMRNIITATEKAHLHKALFSDWMYDDPMQGTSMRWEPSEDRRHAYRWTDPTDASQRRVGSMLGANRLAIEGLPFYPTAPVNRPGGSTALVTAGFRRSRTGDVEWTWPIWEADVPSPVIVSILGLKQLQQDRPPAASLRAMGIAAVFRSTRISVDYFRNFTPASTV